MASQSQTPMWAGSEAVTANDSTCPRTQVNVVQVSPQRVVLQTGKNHRRRSLHQWRHVRPTNAFAPKHNTPESRTSSWADSSRPYRPRQMNMDAGMVTYPSRPTNAKGKVYTYMNASSHLGQRDGRWEHGLKLTHVCTSPPALPSQTGVGATKTAHAAPRHIHEVQVDEGCGACDDADRVLPAPHGVLVQQTLAVLQGVEVYEVLGAVSACVQLMQELRNDQGGHHRPHGGREACIPDHRQQGEKNKRGRGRAMQATGGKAAPKTGERGGVRACGYRYLHIARSYMSFWSLSLRATRTRCSMDLTASICVRWLLRSRTSGGAPGPSSAGTRESRTSITTVVNST